ncbi:MAG: DUF3846 domain-containing protein [Victivallaceae bacterium]|nr:DUF3846 domain-containing protein [Victivallaceae bacterium]
MPVQRGGTLTRAIFIDAEHRLVSEIQIENDLQAFYDKIGCRLIQLIDCGMGNDLVCDEEGRLRDWKVGFQLPHTDGIAGNALVVCSDADGDFTDCDPPVKLFADSVRFLDLTQEPLPEPRQVFVPIEGELTEENIEKARLIAAFLMHR